MKTLIRAAIASVIVLSLPQLAWSKGATKMLVIDGASLPVPIETSDPDIVGTFNVWNGPGVRVNGQAVYLEPENLVRSFIDWSMDTVPDRPEELSRFEVTFVVDGRTPPRNRYVVTYAFDPSASGGYIYLPRTADNTAMIWHGVEGNWFRSSESWERLVRPLIEVARNAE